jgi:hypothetical protein
MNAKDKGALIATEGKRPPRWKSSLYEEPDWVSLAWIVGPIMLAACVIYFAVR